MRARHLRRTVALAAVTALGATGFATVGASAADRQDDEGDVATLTMAVDGKALVFEGPTRVEAGADLRIVNETDPRKIGPHTFSLVEKDLRPNSEDEAKDCFKFKLEVCVDIAKAHKVDFRKETIGKPDVEVGKKGWDASFGKKGDTWFTFEEDEETERKITAKAGSKLFYLCVIHPEMQGKLKVK